MAEVVVERRTGGWASRSLRERRLILVMLALAALVVIWFLVLRPLSDARASAEERLAAATTDLGTAHAEALMARRSDIATDLPMGDPVPLPLDNFLSQQGGEQGFTNIQVTGQGNDRARVAIPTARAQPFLAWVGQLETRGVVVESLTARANADQTIAVEATVRAGGRP